MLMGLFIVLLTVLIADGLSGSLNCGGHVWPCVPGKYENPHVVNKQNTCRNLNTIVANKHYLMIENMSLISHHLLPYVTIKFWCKASFLCH